MTLSVFRNTPPPQVTSTSCPAPDCSPPGGILSQTAQLEQMYCRKVKQTKEVETRYEDLFQFLIDMLISKMKASSTTFDALYSRTYLGGSFFDGLKVGSKYQEFDINILFKWKEDDLEVVRLGEDTSKKNFCYLKVKKQIKSKSKQKIVDTDHYASNPANYLSPIKMFRLLKSCVDRVLTSQGNTLSYQGRLYRVTRHEFAPVTLKVVSLEDMEPMTFEVDLVPSLELSQNVLAAYPELQNHIASLCEKYGVNRNKRRCMAISLHRADHHKFELDFHDIERRILYNRGCVKKVIKLVKFLRDSKGGHFSSLWSHLLKVSCWNEIKHLSNLCIQTSVMHHVLETPEQYWSNANLEQCFVDTLRHLLQGLKKDCITDVFFPSVRN